MSNNINLPHANALEMGVHLEELAPRVNDNPARVNGVGMDVRLDAIENVAHEALGNYRAEIADFCIQSHTGLSTANARVSAKERETLTPLIQSLADSLAHRGKIARINPNLNIIVIIKANGTRETLYADQLEGDAKAHFERLKLHYNTKHGGFACTRPTFTNGNKANLKGFQPFYTKVSEDPKDLKASAFVAHENFAKITEGMTEEKKLIVMERIKLVEILVVQKIKRYEGLIKAVKKEIQKSKNENDIENLQKDLTKLQKNLQELKRLDPVALYWLAAFYPENPDDKDECKMQALAIEAKAKEILKDSSHAHDLASVLIKDRQEYFFFSGSKGMQNTQPMEDILREVVNAENGDHVEIIEEYESDLVKDELQEVHNKLNDRIESRVNKLAQKKAEFEHRVQLANEFVDERLRCYKEFEGWIQEDRALLEKSYKYIDHVLQDRKNRAVNFLIYYGVRIQAPLEIPHLIDLLRAEANDMYSLEDKASFSDYARRIEDAYGRVNHIKKQIDQIDHDVKVIGQRIDELERLSNIDLEFLAHYYVEGSKKQKNNLNALAVAAKRQGYNEAGIKKLKQDIMNSDVRKMLRAMMKFKKNRNSDSFANAALRSLEKGSELVPKHQDAVRRIEKDVCDSAKARFNGPVNLMRSVNIIEDDV
ncbi:MAG: hypothetical protein V4494_06880 [Chlamydiota bacterium]